MSLNPLRLFDYVYYTIAYIYTNLFDFDEQKEFAGIGILSLLQLSNGLVLIRFVFGSLEEIDEFHPFLTFILGYAIILPLNIIRYKKFVSYSDLDKQWGNDSPIAQFIKIGCLVLYIIFTVFLFSPY